MPSVVHQDVDACPSAADFTFENSHYRKQSEDRRSCLLELLPRDVIVHDDLDTVALGERA